MTTLVEMCRLGKLSGAAKESQRIERVISKELLNLYSRCSIPGNEMNRLEIICR